MGHALGRDGDGGERGGAHAVACLLRDAFRTSTTMAVPSVGLSDGISENDALLLINNRDERSGYSNVQQQGVSGGGSWARRKVAALPVVRRCRLTSA